jgi:hypothetical protein
LNEIVSLQIATWFVGGVLTSAQIARFAAKNAPDAISALFLSNILIVARAFANPAATFFTYETVSNRFIDRVTQSMKAELLIVKNDSDALPQHHTEFPNRPIKRI